MNSNAKRTIPIRFVILRPAKSIIVIPIHFSGGAYPNPFDAELKRVSEPAGPAIARR
ncbi:MAG: hypothetical protein HY674_13705 [Chloroflexi bacterium]|nr:hypothetical protein [Chloroflexota bacterium]